MVTLVSVRLVEGKRSVNLVARRKPRKDVKQSVSLAAESRAIPSVADAAEEDANPVVNFILYLNYKIKFKKTQYSLYHLFFASYIRKIPRNLYVYHPKQLT